MAGVWELTAEDPMKVAETERLLNSQWEPFGLSAGAVWYRRLVAMTKGEDHIVGLAEPMSKGLDAIVYTLEPIPDTRDDLDMVEGPNDQAPHV